MSPSLHLHRRFLNPPTSLPKQSMEADPITMPRFSILILAGEASGDYHAAALVREIKQRCPEIAVKGIGGEKLADAGMELLYHYRDINTVAFGDLEKLRNIVSAYFAMKRELRSGLHQLFIPVDFPDVNIRLCRHAKAAGVPVCYYISPQVWAWRRGRVRKIARRVDRMMTIFPFEKKHYAAAGLDADFVGHTMVRDQAGPRDREAALRDLGLGDFRYTVALLPGSRPAEIRRMLPAMCGAGAIFASEFPDARFVLPLAGEHLARLVTEIASDYGLPLHICSVPAARVMEAADCGLVTSGTATLQAALAGLPHAVVYKIHPFAWWLALRIIKPLLMDKDVHLAIANVLAIDAEDRGGPIKEIKDAGYSIPCQECGRQLFVPEILQNEATPENLAKWLVRFRNDPSLCLAMQRGFSEIRSMLLTSPGSPTAADIVLETLEKRRQLSE